MTQSDNVRIDVVTTAHAGELLTVRRASFVVEAQLYNDPNIPALTQTLEALQIDLESDDVVMLRAWEGPRLIGSIRVGLEGDKATMGRLAAGPGKQGLG